MSFFGMSQTGKDAMGKIGEIPNWQFGQAKDYWGKANQLFPQGNDAMSNYLNWQQGRMANGIGGPSDMISYGQQLTPWTQGTMNTLNDNYGNATNKYNSLPGTQSYLDQISGNLDQWGNTINGQADQIGQDIASTAGRQQGYQNNANDIITGDASNRYNGLIGNTNSAYGNLTGKSDATYGDLSKLNSTVYGGLEKNSDNTFNNELSNTEMLRPGGEFQQATVARNFAPQMASTQAGLRRMGVGAGDPESVAATAGVQAARARAMDDMAGNTTAQYVGAKNSVMNNSLANQQGLQQGWLGNEAGFQQGKLGNEIGLGQANVNATNNLSREQGGVLRGQAANYANTASGIDQSRLNANTQNENNRTGEIGQYYGQRNGAVQYGQGLDQQDYGNYLGLMDRGNQTALTNNNLQNGQLGYGMNYNQQNLAEKNAGAQGVGGYGQFMMGQSLPWASMGNSSANDAMRGYGSSLAAQSASAGWGVKMLGGLAGAGLNMIAPGSGNMLMGGINGAYGGGGGYGGYGMPSYGGYGMPSYGGYGGTPPFFARNPSSTAGGAWDPEGILSRGSDGIVG